LQDIGINFINQIKSTQDINNIAMLSQGASFAI